MPFGCTCLCMSAVFFFSSLFGGVLISCFPFFFLRCSWHIITRICVQAKSYFCLKQSKNTFLLKNKKKEKQTTATILNENNAFAYNFHYLCACLPVNISPLWRIPRGKNRQATERKGSQKSNYCVAENDITVEQIRTVVYIYFDLRCCWHVTAAAAACLFLFIWFCFYSVLLNSFASFVYFGHNKLECGVSCSAFQKYHKLKYLTAFLTWNSIDWECINDGNEQQYSGQPSIKLPM